MKEITSILQSWNAARVENKPAVLATVVRVEGSHYRKPGARMIAVPEAAPTGSVSGGCLESDVLLRARGVIEKGAASLVQYDTTSESDLIFGTGMGCGGIVDILIEPLNSPSADKMQTYLKMCVEKHAPFAVATVYACPLDAGIKIGDRVICTAEGGERIGHWEDALFRATIHELGTVLTSGHTHNKMVSGTSGEVHLLFERVHPPVGLLIVGAGDSAIPLCQFALGLGWQVTVVDHRATRLDSARFGQAALLHCQPDAITGAIDLNKFDAAVIMTHNYHYDRELLAFLSQAGLKYVGLLGAAKRAGRIMNDLVTRKPAIDPQLLKQVHAPIGLDLKAEGAAEIALAILAEIQMTLTGGTGIQLSLLRAQTDPTRPLSAERVG